MHQEVRRQRGHVLRGLDRRRGECEIKHEANGGAIAAVVSYIHKGGHMHRQSIDAQTLAAIERLRARAGRPWKKGIAPSRGAPAETFIRKVLIKTAKQIGVRQIRIGSLRHSFTMWAREGGKEIRVAQGGLSFDVIAAARRDANPVHDRRADQPPSPGRPATPFNFSTGDAPDKPSQGPGVPPPETAGPHEGKSKSRSRRAKERP
jgi:hypothetical protein